jgi:hypothetical protein
MGEEREEEDRPRSCDTSRRSLSVSQPVHPPTSHPPIHPPIHPRSNSSSTHTLSLNASEGFPSSSPGPYRAAASCTACSTLPSETISNTSCRPASSPWGPRGPAVPFEGAGGAGEGEEGEGAEEAEGMGREPLPLAAVGAAAAEREEEPLVASWPEQPGFESWWAQAGKGDVGVYIITAEKV